MNAPWMGWRSAGVALALLLSAQAPAGAAGDPAPATATTQALPVCEARNTGFGTADLRCTLAPGEARRLRFEIAFAGVHDDSQAALAVLLGGQPLACGAGSLPRITGEEAGPSLACLLAVPAAPGPRELLVHLLWYHAEPNGFRWRED